LQYQGFQRYINTPFSISLKYLQHRTHNAVGKWLMLSVFANKWGNKCSKS